MNVDMPPKEIRRVLILTKQFRYGYGGTPEAVFLLAQAFNGIGVSTDVYAAGILTRGAGALPDLPQNPSGCSKTFSWSGHPDYDLIIIAGAWQLWALPLALWSKVHGVRLLYAPKGQLCRIEFTRLRDARRAVYFLVIEHWLPRLADNILFTSKLEQSSTLLPDHVKRSKGVIVPEILTRVRCEGDRGCVAEIEGAFTLGFIAQISPRKGLAELVDGFLSWASRNPNLDVQLQIAGTVLKGAESYFSSIQTKIAVHPFGKRIIFLGQVSGAKKAQFYSSINALVIPSKFESYCLVLLEALLYGVPAIAAPNLGVLEYLNTPGVILLRKVDPVSVEQGLDELAQKFLAVSAAAREFALSQHQVLSGHSVLQTLSENAGLCFSRAFDPSR